MHRIQVELDRVTEVLAGLRIQEITDDMQTKLPREIRDMIYPYLGDASRKIAVYHSKPIASDKKQSLKYPVQLRGPKKHTRVNNSWPVFPKFTCQDTSREVLETIYRYAIFQVHEDCCLEHLLQPDHIVSPTNFISKLYISIPEADYRPPTQISMQDEARTSKGIYQQGPETDGEDLQTMVSRREELIKHLELLHGLRNCKAQITIRIDLHRWSIFDAISRPSYTQFVYRPSLAAFVSWTRKCETEARLQNAIFEMLVDLLLPVLLRLVGKGPSVTVNDSASEWTRKLYGKQNITVGALMAERRQWRIVSIYVRGCLTA
jgi:hypothetical protein